MVTGPDGVVAIGTRKGEALLAYLAAQPDRSFTRSHLASLLWEGSGEAGARRTLTTVLGTLSSRLPALPLRATRDSLGWEPSAPFEVDTVRFLALSAAGADRARLAEAAGLYRGPFLEGLSLPGAAAYEEWLHAQRMQWERRVLGLLDRLAQAEEAAGDWEVLAAQAERALAIDPLQERFHRWRMLALAGSGDRAGALWQYELCRRALAEALEVSPEPATQALRRTIAAGQPAGAGAPAGPSPRPCPAGSVSRSDVPFVGRQVETARLRAALTEAMRGGCRGVLLHGEAGAGKTRLVQEALAAGSSAASVLTGHCYEISRTLPYGPFIEALSVLPRRLPQVPGELPGVWLAEVGRLVPDLLPHGRSAEADAGTPARHRLLEGVVRLLALLPQPLLFILEDIQWADEASLLLLAHILRHPVANGIAVLATARLGELPAGGEVLLRRLQREGALDWQEVGDLAPEALTALATAAGGEARDGVAEWLQRETGGNPLFAVEMLRAVREGDPPPLGQAEPGIPPGLHLVVRRRLATLPPPAVALLDAAALMPGPVRLPLLHEVAGLEADVGTAALDHLLHRRILSEAQPGGHASSSRGSTSPTPPAVTVRSGLMAKVIRDTMGHERRRELSRRAYQGLAPAPGGPAPADPSSLAHLAAGAGLWEDALRWGRSAADAAADRFDYRAAAGWHERALEAIERLPPTPGRRRQAVDVRLRLVHLDLCARPQRAEAQIEALLAADDGSLDAVRRLAIRRAQAVSLMLRGRLALAEAALHASAVPGRLPPPRAERGRGTAHLGQVRALQGELPQAAALLQAVPRDYVRELLAFGTLADVWASLGEFGRAESFARGMAAAGTHRGNPVAAAFGWAHLAYVHHTRGLWAEAAAEARQAVALARAAAALLPEYVAMVVLGLPLARTGRLDEGIREQERALALADRSDLRLLAGRAHGWLGEILLEAGSVDAAAAAARTGMRIAEEDGSRYGVALCGRVQGMIAAAEDRTADARRHLGGALALAAAIAARPEEARCHAALARLARTERERGAHRDRAAALFAALGMSWDLARLHAG